MHKLILIPLFFLFLASCQNSNVSSSSGDNGFEGPLKNYIYYSWVNQVDEYNEDKEYFHQDQLEKELRQQFGQTVHSIQNRETFTFDTYKEASEHRYSYIN